MHRFFTALYWSVVRFLVRLRYRVTVVGGERLRDLHGPTLVMPNHPGYIDPPLVLSHLHVRGGVRPVVWEGMYRNPALYPMMCLVDALEVPDLSEHSRDARDQTLSIIGAIVEGLQRGESFLVYPSGRAQRGAREEVGAARAASEILERSGDVNIVLVRTRGVWGSMFSFARTGQRPNLASCALRGIGWMLVNLLFFAPRRNVTITVEVLRRSDLPGVSRDTLNRYLEEWYNRGEPDLPRFVPYHYLFGPSDFEFPDLTSTGQIDHSRIRPATIRTVNTIVEEHLKRSLSDEENQPETTLEQLGLDSLERMDVALKIEDQSGFHSDRVANTLGELWALGGGLLTGAGNTPLEVPKAWSRPIDETEPAEVLGDTIPEAFVRRALRDLADVAVADQVSGVLTYRRLLMATRLLGQRFGELPGEAIGILLPASVAADIVFFALHLQGKLPVLLNWTTGPANLAHAVATLGVKRVVTSRKLIDRLGIEVRGADYVFLEDVRASVGKFEGALALLTSYLFPRALVPRRPRPDPDAPAVVLFTSGSESTPKAVPLSHRNLLTNVRACLNLMKFQRRDVMLGFLPPFHSFGLMGTMIAPIVSGIRMVHHPDPTDAAGLVRTASAYETSLLVSTPTFLSFMFAVAKPHDLRAARIIVSGAEKCPEALFTRAKELVPQATIVEGYGITECSPVVAANRPEHIKMGTVGRPVDGVEICLVDPETKQPVSPGQMTPLGVTGLLLVRGPSIFQGYLNYDGPDPFVEVEGKRWYVTGDLVQLDEDRCIRFAGRLKRFLKAGGEMISLPALEEPLTNRYPPTDKGPQVAVEGIETPDGRHIVLFTTLEIPLRDANAILAEAGFRGVMRLDEVQRVDAIPVLGTGKTDYKVLRRKIG